MRPLALPIMIYFPGQIESIVMSLEQVTCLASADRNEVYWSFSPRNPMTVAEIAKLIGKSPQTIHHHVNNLIKNDFLMSVGTRKKRSRQEALYVWKFVKISSQRAGASPEYLQQIVDMFNSVARNMSREFEKMHNLFPDNPHLADLNSFYTYHLSFDPQQMNEVREVFRKTIARLAEISENSESGNRYHIVTFAYPTSPSQNKMIEATECTPEGEHFPQ